MDKRLNQIYTMFIAIACIIVVVYAFKSAAMIPERMFPQNTEVAITPVTETIDSDDIYYATLDASEIVEAGGCLSFSTVFANVWVYSGDDLIYKCVDARFKLIRSTGTVWNFVRISDANKPVKVKLEGNYDWNRPPEAPEYSAGDYYNIKTMIVVGSTPVFIISILDIFFGLIMIVYSYATRRINLGRTKIAYIGLTALLIGLWSAGETNAMVVLMTNRSLAGVFAFLILILIPIPYVMYIHAVLWKQDKFLYRIPIFLSFLDFVVVITLAMTGIMDLKESVIITHLTWAVAIIYVVAGAIKVLRTKKSDRDQMAVFNAASMLVLIAVTGLEIGYYWTGIRLQNDLLGRILILFYIVLLAYKNIKESLKDIEKGRMAEYYKELANTDSMTGLANRTAFNHDLEKLAEEKEYSIVSMDLNNLKEVNDTKGHLAGDRYIINAAWIIKNAFGNDGICYRIGGDEFSVIIKKPESGAITSNLISKLEEGIRVFNSSNPSEPVTIAVGFESKTPDSDRSYNDILHSADEKMYENKRMLKS